VSKESKPGDRWRQVYATAADRPPGWCRGCGYHPVVYDIHRDDCTTGRRQSVTLAGQGSLNATAVKVTNGWVEPEPPLATQAQHRKMHALFREAGITDRDERLAAVGHILGRDLETSKTLTKVEASKVIDIFQVKADQTSR
jgi:hypothetical protein